MQDESALVCAARRGDKEALQVLLNRHWAWLKGLVYGVLADSRDLDDVLQEVCLRVITRIHTVRDPERFRGWLAIVARREALKHLRQRPLGSLRQSPESLPSDEYVEDPLEGMAKKELCERILEAVKTLPEKYREVFMLVHTGGLRYADMARILDVPMTTMQIRLVRARRMIQNHMMGKRESQVQEK